MHRTGQERHTRRDEREREELANPAGRGTNRIDGCIYTGSLRGCRQGSHKWGQKVTDAVSKDVAGIVEEEIGEIAAQRKVLLDYSSYEAQRAGAHTGRDGA